MRTPLLSALLLGLLALGGAACRNRRQVFYARRRFDAALGNCPGRAGSASPYSTRMAASSTWCSTAAPCNSRVVKASATDCG